MLDSDETPTGEDNDAERTEFEPGRRVMSFATHLTGYRPSELDHDEYCIFHDH